MGSVLRLDDICRRLGAGETISDDDVNYLTRLAQDNGITTEGGDVRLGQVCSDLVAEINETLNYSIEGMLMDMPYLEAGFVSHYTPRRTVKAGARPNYGPNLSLDIATEEEPSVLQKIALELQALIQFHYFGENSTVTSPVMRLQVAPFMSRHSCYGCFYCCPILTYAHPPGESRDPTVRLLFTVD